jgi:hypothetical protein
MSTPDDVLEWILPPLEELRQELQVAPDQGWEERRAALLERLQLRDADEHPVVKELLERLDETPDDERDGLLMGDEVVFMVHELVRQHVPAVGPDEAGYDEGAWQAYLAQNGPQWDGTEESWEQFREWFAYYAAEQGVEAPATALLEHLSGQTAADRIDTFAQYGVAIGAAAGGDAPTGDAGYDEGTWQAYLAQNGPQWDGTEEGWQQFEPWFAYHAEELGVGTPARALIEQLSAQTAAERVDTFAQYGVMIVMPAADEAAAAEAAAAEPAAGESAAEDPVDEDDAVIVGDALAAHPEFAEMSEEELTSVISEVLDEIVAS